MATTTTTKLVATFGTAEGSTSWTVNHVDPEADSTDIYAFTSAVVTNGSIMSAVPTSVKSVKMVTTTSTDVEQE